MQYLARRSALAAISTLKEYVKLSGENFNEIVEKQRGHSKEAYKKFYGNNPEFDAALE